MPVIRQEIGLSEDNLEDLGNKLRRMHEKAVEYQSSWPQLHDEYYRLYLGKVTPSDWPWPGSHSIHIPMVMVAVDSLSSLLGDAILADRPQVAGTNQTNSETAMMLDRLYFEWLWRKVVSLRLLGDAWNKCTLIDGVQVVQPYWSRTKTVVRQEVEEVKMKTRKTEFEYLGEDLTVEEPMEPEVVIREQVVATEANALRVSVPDMARLFVAPGTDPGQRPGQGLQYPNCPWYFVEDLWSAEELRARRMDGYAGIDDDMLTTLTEPDLTDRERSHADQEQVGSFSGPAEPVHIYFMRQVLPGLVQIPTEDGIQERSQRFDDPRGIPEEIVVWYFPKRRQISRVVPLTRFKPDNKRPHVDMHYSRMPPFFYSLGVPAKVRHVNKLYNSSVKQQMDFGTLVNNPFFFYEPSTMGIIPHLSSISPGQGIPVSNARGIMFPRLPSDPSFWEIGKQTAQMWFEKITSVTDFVQGRSSSMPNQQRTFRGLAQQLQQSNVFFGTLAGTMAESYRELLRQTHSIFQRNAPQSLEFEYFDKEAGVIRRASVGREIFREDVDFTFELNPNRQMQQSNAQNLFGLMMALPYIANKPRLVRGMARDVYAAFGKLDRFDEHWPEEVVQVQEQEAQEMMQQQQPGAPGQQPPQPGFESSLPGMGLQGPASAPVFPPGPDLPQEDEADMAVRFS